MNKTQAKEIAQNEIMLAIQTAFARGDYYHEGTERELITEQLDKQMARIEKLLGYVPSSWDRGC